MPPHRNPHPVRVQSLCPPAADPSCPCTAWWGCRFCRHLSPRPPRLSWKRIFQDQLPSRIHFYRRSSMSSPPNLRSPRTLLPRWPLLPPSCRPHKYCRYRHRPQSSPSPVPSWKPVPPAMRKVPLHPQTMSKNLFPFSYSSLWNICSLLC